MQFPFPSPLQEVNITPRRTALEPSRALTTKRLHAALRRVIPKQAHKHFRDGNAGFPQTTTSQGREACRDSLSRSCQDCLSLLWKPGTDRDLTRVLQLHSAMLEVQANGCPLHYFHNPSGYRSPYRDHIRTARRLFICNPQAGCVLPRRRVHHILPLSFCSQGSNIKTWAN